MSAVFLNLFSTGCNSSGQHAHLGGCLLTAVSSLLFWVCLVVCGGGKEGGAFARPCVSPQQLCLCCTIGGGGDVCRRKGGRVASPLTATACQQPGSLEPSRQSECLRVCVCLCSLPGASLLSRPCVGPPPRKKLQQQPRRTCVLQQAHVCCNNQLVCESAWVPALAGRWCVCCVSES